jgi:hypothetical protein
LLSRLKRTLEALVAEPSAISCRLSPEDLAERRRAWRAIREQLVIVDRDRFAGGFRLVLRGRDEDLEKVALLVAAERECCGWASWELQRNPGEASLRVTGEEELISPLASAFLQPEG